MLAKVSLILAVAPAVYSANILPGDEKIQAIRAELINGIFSQFFVIYFVFLFSYIL